MKERLTFLQELLSYSEVFALIAGLIVWKYIKDKRIKIFIAYLLFIVAGETLGAIFTKAGMKAQNVTLYNYIVIPTEFLFNIWFLYSYMQGKKMKTICILFSVVSILTRVTELTFLNHERFFFSSLSYIIDSLLLLVVILLFLSQFIKTDKILEYYKHFSFWVAIALLIYYLGSFPLFAFYNYLYKTDESSFYVYWEIQMYLNILMYLLFATGLLWINTKYKSLLH